MDIESTRTNTVLSLEEQNDLFCMNAQQECTYLCKRGNSTKGLCFANTIVAVQVIEI